VFPKILLGKREATELLQPIAHGLEPIGAVAFGGNVVQRLRKIGIQIELRGMMEDHFSGEFRDQSSTNRPCERGE